MARAAADPPGGVALARALSKWGVCSRTRAEALIAEGRVAVNGAVRRSAQGRIDMDRDRVTVDGALVTGAARVYIMLNKPRGLVTTADDEQGRDRSTPASRARTCRGWGRWGGSIARARGCCC